MNEMITFENNEFGQLRTLNVNSNLYFVGRDVASMLGYSKPHNAITMHVDDDDTLKWGIEDSLGRNQETLLINESGLYALILGSKLESAKKFKKWVTNDVLPSIRKHGAYATDELLNNPDLAIQVFQQLKAERLEKAKLAQQIEEDKTFTNFGKAISATDDGILIGNFAKLLRNDGINIGRNQLYEWLRDNGYLIKSGRDKNIPSQRYINMNLFRVKETVVHTPQGDRIESTTLITGKGQIYFVEKLKMQQKEERLC
jgi:anti-repressor protein